MPKQNLRQRMLTTRKALTQSEVEALSLLVQRKFISSAEFAKARSLALYSPIDNEVQTAELTRQAFSSGKKVLFPAVEKDVLVFREIKSMADLGRGTFGIHEPSVSCPVYAPQDIDIIIIPGIAFDQKGRRVGYGKGYYDKNLHVLEGTGRLVGLSYDFQLVEEIVGEPHDVNMDLIISETRTIRP